MPERRRSGTFVRGIGPGTGETGTFVWDDNIRKFVKVSDRPPPVASKTLIHGEQVICAPGGETLELDSGPPVFVQDASEKRKYLRDTGTMPAPERRFGKWGGSSSKPVGGSKRKKLKSFAEHFYTEHKMGLGDYMRSKHGEGTELTFNPDGGK